MICRSPGISTSSLALTENVKQFDELSYMADTEAFNAPTLSLYHRHETEPWI